MSNRSLTCTLAAAGLSAVLFSGCAAGSAAADGTNTPSDSTPTTTATTSSATTASSSAPVGTVTGTAPTAPTSAAADPARALALRACTTWKKSDSQSAAEGSGTMDQAAAAARGAAKLTPRWSPLASDMTFLASLPETDNTDADVAKAAVALRRVSSTCAGIGVPGIHV